MKKGVGALRKLIFGHKSLASAIWQKKLEIFFISIMLTQLLNLQNLDIGSKRSVKQKPVNFNCIKIYASYTRSRNSVTPPFDLPDFESELFCLLLLRCDFAL